MIGQLKLCRMGSLYASGNKSRLLDGAESPSWQCARQSQRRGNDPAAGGDDGCIQTCVALLRRLDYSSVRTSPKGKRTF